MENVLNKINLFFVFFSIVSINTKTMSNPNKKTQFILWLAQNAKYYDGMIPTEEKYEQITGKKKFTCFSKNGFETAISTSIGLVKLKRRIKQLKLKNKFKEPYPHPTIFLNKKKSNPNIFKEVKPKRKRSFSSEE